MNKIIRNLTWLASLIILIAMSIFSQTGSLIFQGSLESTDLIINTEASGKISNVYVVPGMKISKGQVLIELTHAKLSNDVREIGSDLNRFTKQRKLTHGTKAENALEIDRFEQELKYNSQNQQALKIIALKDGIIGSISIIPGQEVMSFQSLGSYYSANARIVYGFLPEGANSNLQVGDLVSIASLNNSNKTVFGKVVNIGKRFIPLPDRLKIASNLELTWGHEVDILLPEDHPFLPSEKVDVIINGGSTFKIFKNTLPFSLGGL